MPDRTLSETIAEGRRLIAQATDHDWFDPAVEFAQLKEAARG